MSRRGHVMKSLDEASARTLARREPRQLLQILRDKRRAPYELYFAAEFAGQTKEPGVPEVLVQLLSHDVAVVREGAARGLADSTNVPAVREALEKALTDSVEAVRIAAADALDRE